MFLYRLIDVQQLPEDDRDRSKRVGVMTNCVYKILNSVHLFLLCELFINAGT